MRAYPEIGLIAPNVLLPKAGIDLGKWSVVACDQYTSQRNYWEQVSSLIGSNPSTYNLILPETFLGSAKGIDHKKQIPIFMGEYLEKRIFQEHEGFVYVERKIGSVYRKGLLAAIDLDRYDFSEDSDSLIRATEGTIIDRLPPRIEVRMNAPLELPHILVLIDDPDCSVIGPLEKCRSEFDKLYDFELMQAGGHIRGYLVNAREIEQNIVQALTTIADPNLQNEKYKTTRLEKPLLFAVGDGNHSLATAKSIWEQLKGSSAKNHPARFALVEIVNIHDSAIQFEAIHRILKNVSIEVKNSIRDFFHKQYRLKDDLDFFNMRDAVQNPREYGQVFGFLDGTHYSLVEIPQPAHTLTVGSLQHYLDDLLSENPRLEIDYIHGDEPLIELASVSDTIGFFLPAMKKGLLFESVIKDGPLPRKTFSMGEAHEKRFYLEARRIT